MKLTKLVNGQVVAMINQKFYELPKEKQLKMINAGLEVFGKYEYKRAITDEIAHKANISKGLLFYYFHNKKTFYLYLYEYCSELMKTFLLNQNFEVIDDFFDLLQYGARKKMEIISQHPYIMNFILKVFQSRGEEVSEDINVLLKKELQGNYDKYFKNVNTKKFKDNVDPKKIHQLLLWMSEGYLLEKQRYHEDLALETLMQDFNDIILLMKQVSYKEEYL